MKNILARFLFLAALSLASALHAQVAPSIEWQKSLGGSDYDVARSIQQTTDGGFIVAGYSQSNDGNVSGNHGREDYWIVKLKSNGDIDWQKSFGGSEDDDAQSIQQTSDGGFIVAGYTNSNDGNVSGWHQGYDQFNQPLYDYWIVRLDAAGNLVWQKCLGGSSNDFSSSVKQTVDNGFIVCGFSQSNDGDVTGHHGGVNCLTDCSDYWILKLDETGNLEWQESLGGSNEDEAFSIQQTIGDGFVVAGWSESNDGNVSGNHLFYGSTTPDYWIIRLDSSGNIDWQKSLGGSDYDQAYSIQQTTDSGFIVVGGSGSNDGDVSENHGSLDYWIVKLDAAGNLEWQRDMGGLYSEIAFSVQQTVDDGYIIAGYSPSNNWDVTGNHGEVDYWIVKLSVNGLLMWKNCYGGSYIENAYSINQTSDNGYIIAGQAGQNDGEVTGNHGYLDYWVVKLETDTLTGIPTLQPNPISLSPNPTQSQLTINLTTPTNQVTIRVYDVQGKRIFIPASDIRLATSSIQLNTEKLPDGFYTLQIINNKTGESEVGKFVKQ